MQVQNLLVVDLQPAYAGASQGSTISTGLMRAVLAQIEAMPSSAKVAALYVNEELSGDTLDTVQEFWLEHGASDALLARVLWVEKSYSFLRGWMDNGVAPAEIEAVVRSLRSQGKWDSRDLPQQQLEALAPAGAELCDAVFRDEGVESLLAQMLGQPWQTCGGARDECLLEVEIALNSAGVLFERLYHLTY